MHKVNAITWRWLILKRKFCILALARGVEFSLPGMAHQGSIEVEGEVTECLPNTQFRVKLQNGRIVLCHLSGKMRIHFIRIMPGDRVKLEMTPYDATKGRITYRTK